MLNEYRMTVKWYDDDDVMVHSDTITVYAPTAADALQLAIECEAEGQYADKLWDNYGPDDERPIIGSVKISLIGSVK